MARTLSWKDVLSQEESEVKASTQELKERVLSPNEPSVDIVRIVRQARSEKHKKVFQLQQKRSKRDPSRQYGEMGGAFENANSSGAGMPGP